MANNNAYIIDTIRTPIGKLGGTLSSVRADDLAALTISELVKRNSGMDAAAIEDVILGCANQAGEDNRNIARMASLLAGVPENVPGVTLNRLCASGMNAVVEASRSIKCNEGDLFVAGGVEQMTRAPFVLSKSDAPFGRNVEIFDTSLGWRFVNPIMHDRFGTHSMGETAENVAKQFKINRQDQDEFAYRSQMKAAKASESGRLAKEIVAVTIPRRKSDPIIFEKDEFIRPDTTVEILAKLKPAFDRSDAGSVTAGNSSGLNDGACALLIAGDDAVQKYNMKPKVKVLSAAAVGVPPKIMGIGPIEATKKVLKRQDLQLKQMDVIELNEAFAAQSLACLRELGLKDDDPRVNPNGGAIALGHPLGMSGARIIGSAMHELIETDKRYALCTMCVGVGQGMAVILERLD